MLRENLYRQNITGRTVVEKKRWITMFKWNIRGKGSVLIFQMPMIFFIHIQN